MMFDLEIAVIGLCFALFVIAWIFVMNYGEDDDE